MSSLYDDLPVALPEQLPAVAPATRPHLRAVPDVPLDFDEVVGRLTPRLVRYAARRLGDRHEAEEVVQEALLRAYKNRAALLTEDDVAAWSTCVTGRLVIDRLRVRGRSTSVAEVPEGTRVGRDTADVVVARDEARTALDALDAMPARQAAVLWAREVEGLAYDEIGLRFGMTEPAVRSILTRARKALRKEYAARGGTLPAAGGVIGILAPWADGFGWLDKLRQSAARLTGPAALGVVGTVLLGGGFLLTPSTTAPAEAAPLLAQAVVSEPLDAGAPAPGVTVRPTAGGPTSAAAAASTTRPAPQAPTRGTTVLIDPSYQALSDKASLPCVNRYEVAGIGVSQEHLDQLPPDAQRALDETGAGREACGPAKNSAFVYNTGGGTDIGGVAEVPTVGATQSYMTCEELTPVSGLPVECQDEQNDDGGTK